MIPFSYEHVGVGAPLKDLIRDVVNADDPTLYRRACSALGVLLAEHDGEADEIKVSSSAPPTADSGATRTAFR